MGQTSRAGRKETSGSEMESQGIHAETGHSQTDQKLIYMLRKIFSNNRSEIDFGSQIEFGVHAETGHSETDRKLILDQIDLHAETSSGVARGGGRRRLELLPKPQGGFA